MSQVDPQFTDLVDAAVEMWHQPSGQSLAEWLGWTEQEYAAWVSDPMAIPRAPKHLTRLAHQTPPATQPIAAVDAIARIIEPAVPWDEKAPLYGVADFETRRAAALEKARQLATLHTPPPVATATVDAEKLRLAKDELRALAALIERPPLDDVQLTQDVALRCASAIRVVLATTPPPVATATVVEAGEQTAGVSDALSYGLGVRGLIERCAQLADQQDSDGKALGWRLCARSVADAIRALAAIPTPPAGDK